MGWASVGRLIYQHLVNKQLYKSDTALVTGASSGIGSELARYHALKAGDVVLVVRSENKLNELKAELEKTHDIKAIVISADLAEPDAAQKIFVTTFRLVCICLSALCTDMRCRFIHYYPNTQVAGSDVCQTCAPVCRPGVGRRLAPTPASDDAK